MLSIEPRLEPNEYKNRFEMDEYKEEEFINSKIQEFCNHYSNIKFDCLYMLLYEYIQENLEKFIPEFDYERDD